MTDGTDDPAVTADWMNYSRWVCLKTLGGTENWYVLSSHFGHEAPEPNTFGPDDYETALARADELNYNEVMAGIKRRSCSKTKRDNEIRGEKI